LSSIQQVASSGLDVFAHNVETVERLQGVVRDRRANWQQSLGVLSAAKEAGVQITKTSIMLGCGEHQDEVSKARRSASCNLLGCGQLNSLERSLQALRPSGWAIFTGIAAGQYANQALMQREWGV
jgi:lipoate synthase